MSITLSLRANGARMCLGVLAPLILETVVRAAPKGLTESDIKRAVDSRYRHVVSQKDFKEILLAVRQNGQLERKTEEVKRGGVKTQVELYYATWLATFTLTLYGVQINLVP